MGTRPGRILETIPNTLPRPRARTTSLTPEFIAIKDRCLTLLNLFWCLTAECCWGLHESSGPYAARTRRASRVGVCATSTQCHSED